MSTGITIMLIDDNKIDLFIHSEVIKRIPAVKSVMEYTFAGDALIYLEEHETVAWPQVILLDIHMPIMDGFEFLELYEKLPSAARSKCRVIMLSSSLNGDDLYKARSNSQVFDFIGKPLDARKLMEMIGQE